MAYDDVRSPPDPEIRRAVRMELQRTFGPRPEPRTPWERAAVGIAWAFAVALAFGAVSATWFDYLDSAEQTARARIDADVALAQLLAHEEPAEQERFVCALRRARFYEHGCEEIGR